MTIVMADLYHFVVTNELYDVQILMYVKRCFHFIKLSIFLSVLGMCLHLSKLVI